MKLMLSARPRIPLWLKLLYTAFVCVLVPYYWHTFGPLNFLYFCDVALLVTLPAIWLESPLLLGMQTLAIFIPQMVWVFDVGARLVTGASPIGMTDYMFEPTIPLFVRGLSTFHGWLPFLLLYCVRKVGYDRRAFVAQSICGVALLLICYFFTPMPPAPPDNPKLPVNINFVFGFSAQGPQRWIPGWAWIGLTVVAVPLLMYWPTHWVLGRLFARDNDADTEVKRAARVAAA